MAPIFYRSWVELPHGFLHLLIKLALQEAAPILILAHQQYLPQYIFYFVATAGSLTALLISFQCFAACSVPQSPSMPALLPFVPACQVCRPVLILQMYLLHSTTKI